MAFSFDAAQAKKDKRGGARRYLSPQVGVRGAKAGEWLSEGWNAGEGLTAPCRGKCSKRDVVAVSWGVVGREGAEDLVDDVRLEVAH